MKAILMSAAGAPEVLAPAEVPTPELGGGKSLRVRLHAAGVNPLDTKIRKLHFYYPKILPVILGCDGAGVVEDVGRQVSRFRRGDEVYFFNGGLGAEPGTYAQYCIVHEDYAALKPARLSMEQAAAAPLVLITAWEALVDRIALRSGETLLVHAGAGGVGHIGVQLARYLGARVAATVSDDAKAALVKDLGAELAINYRRQSFVDEVLRWTDGHGTNVVFDTVGGPPFCQSFAALRLYGRIATLLSTACELSEVNSARLRNLIIGYVQMTAPMFLGDVDGRRSQTRILEEGARLFDSGALKIVVSASLPLEEAAQAHRMVEEGHTVGKVVLTIV